MDFPKILQDITAKVTAVKELFEPGDLINSMTEHSSERRGFYDEGQVSSANLAQILKKATTRVFFGYFPTEYGHVTPYVYTDDTGVTNRPPWDYDSGFLKKLMTIAVPAAFGDVALSETRVDPTVRKGFDVAITSTKPGVVISDDNIQTLTKLFTTMTGIGSVTVVPYKVNIYQPGDFFTVHRDSPEDRLLATMIWQVAGNSRDMVIDGKPWEYGDVAVFFTDVLHEVKPVTKYRETISFKVYRKGNVALNPHDTPEFQLLDQVIPKYQHGVLLQSGYMVATADNPVLKGVDQLVYEYYQQRNRVVKFAPVVVKCESFVDDYAHSHDDDLQIILCGDPHPGDDTDKEPLAIEVYNMAATDDPVPYMPVFWLGPGFKIGECVHHNINIGNQSTGKVIEDVYTNVMMVVT